MGMGFSGLLRSARNDADFFFALCAFFAVNFLADEATLIHLLS
jgi:hypothetical protein